MTQHDTHPPMPTDVLVGYKFISREQFDRFNDWLEAQGDERITSFLTREEYDRRAALSATQPAQAARPSSEDVRELSKWLNEGNTSPINRHALARVLHAAQVAQPDAASEAFRAMADGAPVDAGWSKSVQSAYAWAVSGLPTPFYGPHAESDARAEARRCGGTAEAFPLFKGAQSEPDELDAAIDAAIAIHQQGARE